MLPSRPVEIDQRVYVSAGREPAKKTSTHVPYDPEPRGWVSYLDIIAILIVGGIAAVVLLLRWLL